MEVTPTLPFGRRLLVLHLLVWGVLLVTSGGAAFAHEDTLLQLKGTALVGLPKEYAPAELDLKAFRLRVGKRAMEFSPLLKSILDQPHDLQVTASWYHDRSVLPPYLSLQIRPKKKDFSYGILFNLNTLELMELYVLLQESEAVTRRMPIELSDMQKEAVKASVKVLE